MVLAGVRTLLPVDWTLGTRGVQDVMSTRYPITRMAGVMLAVLLATAVTAVLPPQVARVAAASPAAAQPGTTSLPTPEDAVRQYIAGMAAGDVGMILDATAVDEMSAGFDFAAQVERVRAMMLTFGLAPTQYPFFADMDHTIAAAQILGQTKMLVYSLLSTETIDGNTIVPADKQRADAFVAQVDPARLAGLTVRDIRYSNPTYEHNPKNLETAARQAAMYGADELTERLALVELDGKLYEVGFTLLRYGEEWGIYSQVANLANTPILGTAVPTTLEEYDYETSPS